MSKHIGQNLDISESEDVSASSRSENRERPSRFLGIQFDCCGVYGRAYLNRQGTAYEARCPKCLRTVQFQVGEGGTDSRFFTVR